MFLWETEIKTQEDLLPPGAKVGTIPTDLEQSTGLERLEILGKTQGIDIFDMKPLDASRLGKLLSMLLNCNVKGVIGMVLMCGNRYGRGPYRRQLRWRQPVRRLHWIPCRLP